VRYEINRVLTGMGHEVYRSAPGPGSNRPPDVLARRLFERGGIRTVCHDDQAVLKPAPGQRRALVTARRLADRMERAPSVAEDAVTRTA
jgi:hypothetical protein